MKIEFLGADKSVTGSCHCVHCNGKTILIDYGMQQGKDEKIRNNELDINPSDIDLIIATHAHIDHTGRLPLLVKSGYKNPIIATPMTLELMEIMLRDSAHIQEMEAEWKNRKNKRAGHDQVEPLYTMEDVEDMIMLLKPIEYETDVEIFDGINVRLRDSGHLLGSASVKITCKENGIEKSMVFSGDIGNFNIPLIKDPEYFTNADIVVMETTYGGKYHDTNEDYINRFSEIFRTTFKRGGNVVIPSFSVGRTQELLYYIREIKAKNLVKDFPDFPVYVDSPLSEKATSIYDSADDVYLDEETKRIIKSGVDPIKFDNLILTKTSEESIAINMDNTPKVIISSSGMCEAGRIRHHLKHNLWRKDSSVVFVGYQAEGTLGRNIIDGAKTIKLFGESIGINCYIYNLKGLSGHADRNGLEKFVEHFENKPQRIFLVHGEINNMEAFNDYLLGKGYDTYMPNYGCLYDVITDEVEKVGQVFERIEENKHYEIEKHNEINDKYKILGEIINSIGHDKNKVKHILSDVERLIEKYKNI